MGERGRGEGRGEKGFYKRLMHVSWGVLQTTGSYWSPQECQCGVLESYSEGEGSRGKVMRVVVLRGSTEILRRWPQRIISFRSNGVGSGKIQEVSIRSSEG